MATRRTTLYLSRTDLTGGDLHLAPPLPFRIFLHDIPFNYSSQARQRMATEEKGGETEVDMKVEDSKVDGSGSAPRFEIKKWNAVTMWSWDICADTCAICRNSLNEPSIEYQVMLDDLNEFYGMSF